MKKDAVQNLNDFEIETVESLIGYPELVKTEYTANEIKAIKQELINFALSKNEDIQPFIFDNWINNFSELNIPAKEVIKRIRLAKLDIKFGVSEFAKFMNVEINEYSSYYKHKRREELSSNTELSIEKAQTYLEISRFEILKTGWVIDNSDYSVKPANIYDEESLKRFYTKADWYVNKADAIDEAVKREKRYNKIYNPKKDQHL